MVRAAADAAARFVEKWIMESRKYGQNFRDSVAFNFRIKSKGETA